MAVNTVSFASGYLVRALLRNARNSSLTAAPPTGCTIVDAPVGVALMIPNVDSFGRLTPFSVKRAVVHPNR